MKRILRGLALAIGSIVLVVLIVAINGIALRYLQVRLFSAPDPPEHAAQKAAYLASIEPVDRAIAPNFLVIFFDDLGWGDLSSYGNRLIATPRIDQAAADGLRMTDFYSASPVCTPSRAALLTGRFPPRTGTDRHVFFPEDSLMGTARKMIGWGNELPRDEITLAEALRAAGYRTGMIGKWHLGDRPEHRPTDFGFDDYFGVMYSNDMQPLDLWRSDRIEERDTTTSQRFGYRHEDGPIETRGTDQSRLTERYTEEAIAFLEAQQGTPFLLYLAHNAPHVPHFASVKHAGESQGGLYGDVVEDLDRSTGAILDALDRLALTEKTLVLITSDNGADYNGSPGPLRGRKGEILEGGQRVPMIARFPGRIAPGRVSDQPAMNTDVFPTLLALAGVPLPTDRAIDGRDLSTLLVRGDDTFGKQPLYFFPVVDSLPGAIRSGLFKYLLSTGDAGRDRPHLSRVDLDAEAHELSSLHPGEAGRLRMLLASKRDEIALNPRGWIEPSSRGSLRTALPRSR